MEEGTITDAIQHALQKVGIPKTFAGIGAKDSSFIPPFHLSYVSTYRVVNELKNKKNNRYLIIGIGYLILFFIVLTPDINNAVGRGIQALLFCVLGYRCEKNIRRFIKNR